MKPNVTAALSNLILEIPSAERAQLARIVQLVTSQTGISAIVLEGRIRTERVANARHLAMALVRASTSLSLSEIGGLFRRDHSTVVHAVRAVSARCDTDAAFSSTYHQLLSQAQA